MNACLVLGGLCEHAELEQHPGSPVVKVDEGVGRVHDVRPLARVHFLPVVDVLPARGVHPRGHVVRPRDAHHEV